jgi:hypothetical protein
VEPAVVVVEQTTAAATGPRAGHLHSEHSCRPTAAVLEKEPWPLRQELVEVVEEPGQLEQMPLEQERLLVERREPARPRPSPEAAEIQRQAYPAWRNTAAGLVVETARRERQPLPADHHFTEQAEAEVAEV